jgi:hypothetical protein
LQLGLKRLTIHPKPVEVNHHEDYNALDRMRDLDCIAVGMCCHVPGNPG